MISVYLLFGKAVDAGAGEGPLTLAANKIAGDGCGTFVAGNPVVFHVRNDVAGINALFQQFGFILQDVTPLFFNWNPF